MDTDCKGASIKYVRTEGKGGAKKPENMRTIGLIGCVKSVQEGEGVKKAGKSARSTALRKETNGCHGGIGRTRIK